MKRRALLLAPALAIPGCDRASSDILGVSETEPVVLAASAAQTFHERLTIPMAFSGVSPCTGESFQVSGELAITFHFCA
jgi:hypothetical protein